MENKEKKEYGGCLSILLPLWIIGQILTIIYNLVFAGFYTDLPLIPIILIGINIIALVGIILLLQFKKIGFYIFILTFIITFFVGVFFPDYVRDNTIFKSIFGLGLFLLLMSFKSKETKLNGYQTLGIFNSRKNKEGDASPQIQDDISNEIKNESVEKEGDETVCPEEGAPLISGCINEYNNNKEKIEVDACSIEVKEINHKEKKEKKKKQSVFSLYKRIKQSNKGIRIGIYSCLGVLLLFLAISLFVLFKSYPNYISSFSDKVRYSFNLSNNQLGKTLFERVSSSRSESLHLIVTPGYENEVFDSKDFYKVRVDEFREYPSSSFYIATTPINSFEDIISNQYYIIKPETGEPYACKGSELSLDGENARYRIIYKTVEYDYKNNLDKEMSLVDEASQIPVSDIDIIREIGGYYEHEGILSKAADYYRFALEHNGNNPQIRGMLAYVLALNGESEVAREEAEKAIDKEPKEQRALSALALLEADEFNWKEAKTYAKKAIDYGAENSNVYLVYCEALYKQGEIKAAKYYYNKAYELYRYNPRLERYKEYAGCPFEVLAFHYCSERMDGKNVIPYDEKLVRSKCFYIGFKIDVNILRSERAKIGVKLFTNGRLITGQGSKDGYTYFENVGGKDLGKNFYYISGWGNESGGFWSVGSHEIEIWYEGNKIAESSFYVY